MTPCCGIVYPDDINDVLQTEEKKTLLDFLISLNELIHSEEWLNAGDQR